MIWYFQKGLCLSVRVKIEQRGQELNSFKELVKKTVDVEAKTALQPRSYACETDQNPLRGNRLLVAKASTKGQPMKDPKVKKSKSRTQESKTPAPQHSNSVETSEQARKKKKKKDKQHQGQKPQKGSTPTTRSNLTYPSIRKPWTKKDISEIICYNYSKNRNYADKCSKPPKLKN